MMTARPSPLSQPLLVNELTQCLFQFFRHLDDFQYQDMVALFAQDGIWLRQGQTIRGREAIRLALEKRPTAQRIRHVMTNAFIANMKDGRVCMESYMTAYRHENPSAYTVPVISGPFRLNLVTTWFVQEQGLWLIAEQHMLPEFNFEQQ
jgi:hypothetical protein